MFYAAWRKFSPALNRHFEIIFHVAFYCASGADPRESGGGGAGAGAGTAPLELPLHCMSAEQPLLPWSARVIVLPSPAGRRSGMGWGKRPGGGRRRRAAATRAGARVRWAPRLSADDHAPESRSDATRPEAGVMWGPPGTSPDPFPDLPAGLQLPGGSGTPAGPGAGVLVPRCGSPGRQGAFSSGERRYDAPSRSGELSLAQGIPQFSEA
ncbi:uncharacterized protein LOC120622094 [Pteropus medius]|uniref:uncharacterized protein LOC120622094 n=1 Tax=Pteropus vampyrus TaxID=132908 RepID=UPI00196B061C|nr:uncharacterized protein LOC120622094 [Pteropus giganteus]